MSIETTPYGTYRVRWRDAANKDRAKSFKKKSEARDFETKLRHELRSGTYVDRRAGRVSLEDWADEWLKASMHLGDGGRETYRRDLDAHILPVLGDHHLAALTPELISEYLSDELEDGLAQSTVNRHYRTLNTMLKAAVKRRKLPTNPCEPVDPPKVVRAEMLFLEADQVQLLADAIAEHYRAWVLVAAYSGVRWSEAVGLRRRDVDGDRLTVTGQLKRRADGEWHRSGPKTAAGRRTIKLPAAVADELATHIDEYALPGANGLIFPNREGRPTGVESFTGNVFKPALVRADIEVVTRENGTKTSRVRIHDLRHTSVALAVKVGAHPKAIQARMGHASITVTLDRYGHLFPEIDDTVADALDGVYQSAATS